MPRLLRRLSTLPSCHARGVLLEHDARLPRRAHHGLGRLVRPEQRETVEVAQPGRDPDGQRGKLAEVVFTDREDCPETLLVAEQLAQLVEEEFLGLAVARIERQDLLELVEHPELLLAWLAGIELVKAFPGIACKPRRVRVGQRQPLLVGERLVERREQAVEVAVGMRARGGVWFSRIGLAGTRNPLARSRGMRPAWRSEVLPAPEGEWSRTIRSAIVVSTSSRSSCSRPNSGSPSRSDLGPT